MSGVTGRVSSVRADLAANPVQLILASLGAWWSAAPPPSRPPIDGFAK